MPFRDPIGTESATASEQLAVALVGKTVEAVHPEHANAISVGADDGTFVLLTPTSNEGLLAGFELKVQLLPRLREARIKEAAAHLLKRFERGEALSSMELSPYELAALKYTTDGDPTLSRAEALQVWLDGG